MLALEEEERLLSSSRRRRLFVRPTGPEGPPRVSTPAPPPTSSTPFALVVVRSGVGGDDPTPQRDALTPAPVPPHAGVDGDPRETEEGERVAGEEADGDVDEEEEGPDEPKVGRAEEECRSAGEKSVCNSVKERENRPFSVLFWFWFLWTPL